MSASQIASKLPKPGTVVGAGLSAAALYILYRMNERKKRLQVQIQDVKDGFGRIKEDQSERLKQAKEDFKCMPAVQEAQQQVMAQTTKWQEGKERFKENRAAFKEAMKRNKAYQELASTMPDLVKRAETELDTAWQLLEVIDSEERVKDIIAKNPKDGEELTLTIENCRGSMDRAAELLGQERKSLGWTLVVAGELNNLRTQTKKLKTWIEASH